MAAHLGRLQEPLGLYLHIPFCKDRCTYCSFVSTRNQEQMPEVLARLEADLHSWGKALETPAVDTLYFGGGTPSLLDIRDLKTLTTSVQGAFDLSSLEESTLEANPGTLRLPWLAEARNLGWNRLSLGIQSLDDDLLSRLGRIHRSQEGLEALAMARQAGFTRISADLMAGVPNQNLDRILADGERLLTAGATHLSIYLLDLDKSCPMKTAVDRGDLDLPSEDAVADLFEQLQEHLPRLGLQTYEISNWAIPGEESRHNLRYWKRRPYLGLGPSAASHLGRWRWTESPSLSAWLSSDAAPEVQELSPEEELAEIPLLGLRTRQGVDWAALRRMAQAQGLLAHVETWEASLKRFEIQGLLARHGSWIHLTPRGMLLSNAIFQLFV